MTWDDAPKTERRGWTWKGGGSPIDAVRSEGRPR